MENSPMENNDYEGENTIITTTATTTSHGSTCSACKYQRKRCKPDCILRKHFPSNKFEEFKNVQKVFGIANITKMIRSVINSSEEEQRELAESIYYDADAWTRDPVRGPLGEIKALRQELSELKSQITTQSNSIPYNANMNMNVLNVNYPNNVDFYTHSSYASSYARNGLQPRFLQHGSNNCLANNQGVMENGNWILHRNGIEQLQWREQQAMGNFGQNSQGRATFVSETERNRADATIQDFGSKLG